MDFEYLIGFLIVFGYILLTYFITGKIRKYTLRLDAYTRINILSLTYTLLFGIGALTSGGGDPGFAIPSPLILVIMFAVWDWFPNGILSVFTILIPFLFWWTIVTTTMLIKLNIKRKSTEKSEIQ